MTRAPIAPTPAASVGVAMPVYMLPMTSRMMAIMPQMPLSEREAFAPGDAADRLTQGRDRA